jgi:hypothetical protein
MPRRAWLLLLTPVLLLAGCVHRGEGHGNYLAGIQTAPSGYAITGRMYLTLRSGQLGLAGTTSTTMVVHRPDDLYLQVRGPVNNVMVQGTANRQSLVVVVPPRNKAFVAESPDAAMRALTGGALGVDGVLALLMARLPQQGLTVVDSHPSGKGTEVTLEVAGGYGALAQVDRLHRLRGVDLHGPDGTLLATVRYDGWVRDARSYYPKRLTMEIPAIDLYIGADFQAWEVLGEVPPIFTTLVPQGAEVEHLEDVLHPEAKAGDGEP